MKLSSLRLLNRHSLAVLAASIASVATTAAAPIVTFMPPGEWPATDWYQANYGAPVVQTVSANAKEWISISRASDGAGGQIVYTAGYYTDGNLPTPNQANQLTDFTGSVVVSSSSWATTDAVGVVLRSRVSAYHGTDAYFLGLNSSGLGLYWGVGNNFVSSVPALASKPTTESLATLANGGEYLIWFSVVGNRIDASVYSSWTMGEDGKPLGTEISSLTYTDEREEARTSGYFALRANRIASVGRTMYMRDLQLHAIPEPATAATLGVGGLCLLALGIKRRQGR